MTLVKVTLFKDSLQTFPMLPFVICSWSGDAGEADILSTSADNCLQAKHRSPKALSVPVSLCCHS